jgi:hypothetical protein
LQSISIVKHENQALSAPFLSGKPLFLLLITALQKSLHFFFRSAAKGYFCPTICTVTPESSTT